jgi:hypothetical protein
VEGICSNNRHCSLTILDNVLTRGESEEGEEVAGWPHPRPGDLQEGVGGGGGAKHLMVPDFLETFRRWY